MTLSSFSDTRLNTLRGILNFGHTYFPTISGLFQSFQALVSHLERYITGFLQVLAANLYNRATLLRRHFLKTIKFDLDFIILYPKTSINRRRAMEYSTGENFWS
jgi:hypothetical protein